MKEYLIILVGAVLVNNYVLAKFLGICPFLGVSKKLDSAFGMSVAVIFVMRSPRRSPGRSIPTSSCRRGSPTCRRSSSS